MATIHSLTKDACVLAFGTHRFSFRRGALAMLLDREPGLRVERVPLERGVGSEAGDITVSKTGRTFMVRVHDPGRLFLGKTAEARLFLAGTLNVLALFDATDDDAAAASVQGGAASRGGGSPAKAPAKLQARVVSTSAPVSSTAAVSRPSLDDVLRGIYRCPAAGLSCRPGGGVRYPSPPLGRPRDEGVEILLLGWNPRLDFYKHDTLPPYEAWRQDAAAALEEWSSRGDDRARMFAALLPPDWGLASGRVMATWVWKWPTRFKASGEAADFYVGRCVKNHFFDELAALRPRVVVVHEAEATGFMASQAVARNLGVDPPPRFVRSGETRGVVEVSRAWGWPMGLILLKDPLGSRYHPDVAQWVRGHIRGMLDSDASS